MRRLTGVETVLEEANAWTSTALVFLKDDTLPDLDVWRREFGRVANASYALRGIEMNLGGALKENGGLLTLIRIFSVQSLVLGVIRKKAILGSKGDLKRTVRRAAGFD